LQMTYLQPQQLLLKKLSTILVTINFR